MSQRDEAKEWLRENHPDEPALPEEDAADRWQEHYMLEPSGDWVTRPTGRTSMTTITKEEFDRREAEREAARRNPIPTSRPLQAFGGEVFVPRATSGRVIRSAARAATPADGDRCANCHQTYGEHLVGHSLESWSADACGYFVSEWDADDL